MLETVICACPTVLVLVPVGRGVHVGRVLRVPVREGILGTGWVYRVGNTGTPTQPALLRGAPHDSEAGPGSP